MPRYTSEERIAQARKLINEAANLNEPVGGRARGAWVVRRRSLLGHASRWLRDQTSSVKFSDNQHSTIAALNEQIDQLLPEVKS